MPTAHDPLNFTGTFLYLTILGVSHDSLHGVVRGEPHPPEELNGLSRDPGPAAKLRDRSGA
jgi:hypothetical protein